MSAVARSGASVTDLRLDLLAKGYRPVPVTNIDVPIAKRGKAPLLDNWRIRCAAADPADVAAWATERPRDTNTGILCGAVLALDIDVLDPILAARIELAAEMSLGRTLLRRIGRAPKLLLCFRADGPAWGKLATKEFTLPDGSKAQVEALAKGQQFVAFGLHPDTRQPYTWPDATPLTVPLADLPGVTEAEVVDFIAEASRMLVAAGGVPKVSKTPAPIPAAPADPADPAPMPAGNVATLPGGDFFKKVNTQALASLARWVPALFPAAEPHAGTGAWRISSANLGRDLEEDMSIHPDGIRDFGEERTLTPIDLVVQHGGVADFKEAAFWLCKELGVQPETLGWHGGAAPASATGFELTEDGVALAFAADIEGRQVYDHTAGRWFRWDGGRWCQDKTDRTFSDARQFARAARKQAGDARSAAGKIAFAAAVERAARSDTRLVVLQEVWDRDPWVLGVPGGAVDLRTGDLALPDPARFLSRQAAVAPAAPGTPAPLWTAFLHEATGGSADLQGFLQRLAGYVLTGDVTEECLTFIYGPGGNGKGVFLGALAAILGEYALTVPIEVFTVGARINLESHRADMAGARLVTASETEAGATWAESQIKEMTGNETPLSARRLYGHPFTYLPQFKLVIVGNHTPRLKSRTPAMERRLRIVPFTNMPATPDHALKDKLRAEYPAILRWAIDGCLAWQRERLGTCAAIAEATGAYFEGQDVFGQWLAERCDLAPDHATAPGELLADFLGFCRANGAPPITAPEFREMVDRAPGLRRVKVRGNRAIAGVRLRQAPAGDFPI